jgi:hypothetical protein
MYFSLFLISGAVKKPKFILGLLAYTRKSSVGPRGLTDEGSWFLQMVCNFLPDYKESLLRRQHYLQ